jgi:hypothetical protein
VSDRRQTAAEGLRVHVRRGRGMLVRLLGVLVSPLCHQSRPVEVVLDSRHMVTSSSPPRLVPFCLQRSAYPASLAAES